MYSISGLKHEAKIFSDTLEGDDDEEEVTDDIDIGSLDEVRELRPDMSEGIGDWAADPADPKLESKLTSEDADDWESVSDERLWEMAGDDPGDSPVRE